MRNLPDGRVELVAEGEPAELTRFLKDIADSLSGYIDNQDTKDIPATGKYRSFDITH